MLGIVILNYNNYHLVFSCISSIEKICKKKYKIYIVDNGSKNESKIELQKKYSGNINIEILVLEKNIGFARGNNVGCRKAVEDGCKQILITNSDIVFQEYSIDKLSEILDDRFNCCLVFPKVLDLNANLQLKYIERGKATFFTDFFLNCEKRIELVPKIVWKQYYIPVNEIKSPIFCKMFFGCCFMIDSQKFSEMGYFDENTFLYYEERILSEKIREFDYDILFQPNAEVIHLGGGSSDDELLFMYSVESYKYYMTKIKGYPKTLISVLSSVKSFIKRKEN